MRSCIGIVLHQDGLNEVTARNFRGTIPMLCQISRCRHSSLNLDIICRLPFPVTISLQIQSIPSSKNQQFSSFRLSLNLTWLRGA